MPDPELVRRRMEQALESLRAARLLLDGAVPARSISESYYAMLRAGRALLLMNERDPRTHRGTADLLWQDFVEQDELEAGLVEAFRAAMELREGVDYGHEVDPDRERAEALLHDAERFVERVEGILTDAGL